MPAMPGAGGPPQGAPQGAPQGGGQPPQQNPAAQAVQMIMHGYQGLSQFVQQQHAPPEIMKAIQEGQKAAEAMIQVLSGGGGGQPQAPQGPKPPMPGNASAGSKPANF